MNVLLFMSKTEPPPELLGDLKHSGHAVRSAKNAKDALELIGRGAPDIAIVSLDLAGDHFGAIAKAIGDANDVYRALVVLLGEDTTERRVQLYAAGADDVAGSSITPRELASRIKSAERIVRLERRLRERVRELESALARLEMNAIRRGQVVAASSAKAPPGEAVPFLLTPAWRSVEEVLCAMCAQYLQVPFQIVAGVVLPATASPGASVSLTDVEHELRIDLTFVVPAASGRTIAAAFCGDASLVDDEVIRDVVLELANSGMGAVKSAFVNDKYRFTGSTPKAQAFVGIDALIRDAHAKRILTYRSASSFIHIVVAMRRIPRVRIAAGTLREGMVVATDIVNEAGVLIVPAGTRLTETAAERIRRLVPKLEVELADPNASAQ